MVHTRGVMPYYNYAKGKYLTPKCAMFVFVCVSLHSLGVAAHCLD